MPRFPKWKKALRNAGAVLGVAMLGIVPYSAEAQKAKKIGSLAAFKLGLTSQNANPTSRTSEVGFTLVTSGSNLNAKINAHKVDGSIEHFIGSVSGSPSSTVFFHFKDGKVEGKAVLLKEKKSYEYSTNTLGEVEVKEADIHDVVCVDYKANSAAPAQTTAAPAPPAGSYVYNLQSLPGSQNVLKLDFDGEYVVSSAWNGGNPINALPYDITEAGVVEAWEIISEDFRAFNINVTTSEAIFQAAPKYSRMKCIFTPTNTAAPNYGGVAYIGSFQWNDDTPCWVFNGGSKVGAETGSHELGHVMGLGHDGRTSPVEEYYGGTATWAPIMGYSYYSEPGHWSKGEYANANNTEDDIAIIASMPASTTTTVGFRTDEAGSTSGTSKLLVTNASGVIDAVQNIGIITSRTDVDVYRFTSTGGAVNITVSATIPAHANLDVILTLKNSAGTTVASANPTSSMDASVSATLAAGTYYLFIDGTGLGDPVGIGYSDYSSIGRYKITGNINSTTTCLVNETTPASTQFVVRNAWHDEASGSGVSNESGALKVVHRAYGNSDLWVLETGKTFSVTNGQVYNIKFDFKDFAAKPVTNVQVGFATGINTGGTAPNLVGAVATFPSGYSSSSFTTKSVNITSTYTGTVFLAVRLNWGAQPTVQISDYIKNLKVCVGSGAQSKYDFLEEEVAANGLLVSPNPSESEFQTLVQKDVALINIADLQGRSVYSKTDLAKDASFSFGTQLGAGIYMVQVRYVDGTQESFKIVKSK